MTKTVKKKIGDILFGCLLIAVGSMFLFEYARQGHITLKGGMVISGAQAIVVSLSLLIFGTVYSLITLLGKQNEEANPDKSDKKESVQKKDKY